jgi:hypothetical protein
MSGGYGCDMGELPAPPPAVGWILVILGVVAFLVGVQMLTTGRVLLRIGRLKDVSTTGAARVLGLALVLDAIVFVWLAYASTYLSHHQVPPTWAELTFLPVILVTGLVGLAYRINQPRKASQLPLHGDQ